MQMQGVFFLFALLIRIRVSYESAIEKRNKDNNMSIGLKYKR